MSCLNCKSVKIKKKFISLYKSIKYSICGDCGCHYQNPLINYDYKEDTFWQNNQIDPDGIERNHIHERDFKLKNWYGETVNYINSFQNVSILDVGCGLGYFLSALNNKIQKYGIEESEFALNFIKKNFSDVKTFKGSFEILPKINQKFDFVMLYHVIEHLYEPEKCIQFIKNKLKKDGILILGTPQVDTLISNFFGGNYRLYNTSHPILFNFKSLKNLLETNSFEIFKIEKPFWKTDYCTTKNLLKVLNPFKLSPPFYGSIITVYAKLRS